MKFSNTYQPTANEQAQHSGSHASEYWILCLAIRGSYFQFMLQEGCDLAIHGNPVTRISSLRLSHCAWKQSAKDMPSWNAESEEGMCYLETSWVLRIEGMRERKKGTSRFFRKLLCTPPEMLLNMFDTGEGGGGNHKNVYRTCEQKRKEKKGAVFWNCSSVKRVERHENVKRSSSLCDSYERKWKEVYYRVKTLNNFTCTTGWLSLTRLIFYSACGCKKKKQRKNLITASTSQTAISA